jgi:arylsulfatase A-like enzyme
MDRLSSSEHGIRLEKAYSQPICTPTRSQTLTGRYQIHTGLQHGVLWMGQENGIPLNETTAAEYLSRENYTTHAIGKWVSSHYCLPSLWFCRNSFLRWFGCQHVGFANLSMTPLRRGFDTFLGFWG